MKKTSILIIILLVILTGCSMTVVLMTTGIISKGTNDTDESLNMYISNKDLNEYTCQVLGKGTIEISEEIIGNVITNGESIKTYAVEGINNNFSLKAAVGQYVKKNDVLYTDNNGKAVAAENDMQVLSIEKNKDFYMETFVYSNTAISVSIDSKYQNSLNTIGFSALSGEETINLKLLKVESAINDGRINVLLENPFDLLEQSEINIKVKYGEIEDAIAIGKDWVYFDEEKNPYVKVVDYDSETVDDVELNVLVKTEDTYIVDNPELDGCNVGYMIEEKYFSE